MIFFFLDSILSLLLLDQFLFSCSSSLKILRETWAGGQWCSNGGHISRELGHLFSFMQQRSTYSSVSVFLSLSLMVISTFSTRRWQPSYIFPPFSRVVYRNTFWLARLCVFYFHAWNCFYDFEMNLSEIVSIPRELLVLLCIIFTCVSPGRHKRFRSKPRM